MFVGQGAILRRRFGTEQNSHGATLPGGVCSQSRCGGGDLVVAFVFVGRVKDVSLVAVLILVAKVC